MAPQGGQPEWILDPTRNLYFYRDQRTDEYVYQNGYRIPITRPAASNTPRTGGTASGSQQPLPTQFNYSSSPTGDTNYGFGQRGQVPPPQARQDGQSVAGLDAAMNNLTVGQPSSRTYDRGGMQIIEAQNPQSRVRTTYGTSPANRITDPALFNAGVRATRMLFGTSTGEGDAEQLYSNFRMRKRDFFELGRVFLVLWVEPAGETGSVVTSVVPSDQAISTGAFNERVFSKVRRFVVIREGNNYCSALPIATYGGRGVSKRGVKKSEHAIVYTGREAPRAKVHEGPQREEAGLRPIPIRVVPDDPAEALDPMSRLDFGKVHTIQHNIKVRPFGNVHPSSMAALSTQFQNVWSNTPTTVPAREQQQQTSMPSRTAASSSVRRTRAPRSSASGDSRRYTGATEPVEEQSEEEENDDEDDDEDEDEDDDGEDDEYDVVSGSRPSVRGRLASSQPRPIKGARDSSSAQSQQRPVASISGAREAVWSAQITWARNAHAKLTTEQGYSNERAFQWLVSSIMKSQGKSQEAADAEVRALLQGSKPPR